MSFKTAQRQILASSLGEEITEMFRDLQLLTVRGTRSM